MTNTEKAKEMVYALVRQSATPADTIEAVVDFLAGLPAHSRLYADDFLRNALDSLA